MELPQHWVTADGYSPHLGTGGGTLTVWGWSSESEADAARVAGERLAQALERVAREGGLPPGHGYYPRMPLREPVIEEVEAASGAVLGVVTRNRMGCEVLCTDLLFIADVDVPELEEASRAVASGKESGTSAAGRRRVGAGRRRRGGFFRRLLTGDPAPTPMTPVGAAPDGSRMPCRRRPGPAARAWRSAWRASRCGSSPVATPSWGCGCTAPRRGSGCW